VTVKLETQLKHYFRALHETARRGDAREESFYPALQSFLGDWAREQGHEGVPRARSHRSRRTAAGRERAGG
jgi:hypothetical protein